MVYWRQNDSLKNEQSFVSAPLTKKFIMGAATYLVITGPTSSLCMRFDQYFVSRNCLFPVSRRHGNSLLSHVVKSWSFSLCEKIRPQSFLQVFSSPRRREMICFAILWTTKALENKFSLLLLLLLLLLLFFLNLQTAEGNLIPWFLEHKLKA